MTRPVAGLYPSLHLNLGECYRKLGDLDRARDQLERGQVAVGSGDDGFGQMIKGGLDRLGERLASAWELDHPVQTQTFRQARESNPSPSGSETAKGGGQQRPYAPLAVRRMAACFATEYSRSSSAECQVWVHPGPGRDLPRAIDRG